MITITYNSIVDMNLDRNKKICAGRVVGASLIAQPLAMVSALCKKHHIMTAFKQSTDEY